MYEDQIWFVVGVCAVAFFLLMALYLLVSRKRGTLFRTILAQDTETFNAIGAVTLKHGESLPDTEPMKQLAETELMTGVRPVDSKAVTELMTAQLPAVASALTSPFLSVAPIKNFDAGILKGKYTILGEIPGGGMSRVFLARKDNTENEWIVKFVPSKYGSLTGNEAEILKTLNHTSLPKIIDIFSDEQGVYLVESYIEGAGLNRVLDATGKTPEFQVLNWAEELVQVLDYLHGIGQPVFHLDLKPSNIIVTRDNKCILIDFGISRKGVLSSRVDAATLGYAAPEQFKGEFSKQGNETIQRRFGKLPTDCETLPLDGRTDIYSLGVILFEAATGQAPTQENMQILNYLVSPGLCKIIHKCLALHPSDRYQSAFELLSDIKYQKQHARPKMAQTVFMRKVAGFASAVSIALAAFGFSFGFYILEQEAQAAVFVAPQLLTVSLQQHSELQITSLRPDSQEPRVLYGGALRWEPAASHVAQVEGNRVIGLNVGETRIDGWYRMHEISMHVNVVEPMDGMVDISMRFHPGRYVSLYTGTEYRERVDGSEMNFIAPASMDIAADGTIYISDSGWLRRIRNGAAETLYLEPQFLRTHLVRAYHDDVIILSQNWWGEDDGYYYSIFRYSGGEPLYLGDARATSVRDLAVANGWVYFIQRNDIANATYLRALDLNSPDYVTTLVEVSAGTSALTLSGNRTYLADAELGTIQFFENGELTHFAGVSGERAFIDGSAPLFYRPTSIKYCDNAIFVWDFNVLRKIILENGAAKETVSLAGVASPSFPLHFAQNEPAERIVFPYSATADFVPTDSGILLTDPRRGVIWRVDID